MLLEEAGITKQEQAAHPQAVLDVMSFYTGGQLGNTAKFMLGGSGAASALSSPPQPPRPTPGGPPPAGREAPKPPVSKPAPAVPSRPTFTGQGGMVGEQLKTDQSIVLDSGVPSAQPTVVFPGATQAYAEPLVDEVPPPKPSSGF